MSKASLRFIRACREASDPAGNACLSCLGWFLYPREMLWGTLFYLPIHSRWARYIYLDHERLRFWLWRESSSRNFISAFSRTVLFFVPTEWIFITNLKLSPSEVKFVSTMYGHSYMISYFSFKVGAYNDLLRKLFAFFFGSDREGPGFPKPVITIVIFLYSTVLCLRHY